ncbi:MAG: class I SAM-dependent rRNA methyltransferase, partial [Deltaproteobacteria bacterium]|nr:class I SAM-dependent rRNA methyltransferase [Deltaproteobacteria bacterium]
MARRPANTGPVARVSRRGARRARSGQPWLFRSEVIEPAAAPGGSVVRAVDETGNPLGMAFWAERSPIALRLLTRRDEACDRDFFRRRLGQALALRRQLWPDGDCCRLVHGEADLLPGLFVDRYADTLSLQALSEGAELHTPLLVELLVELLRPRLVVAQNDSSGRDFEKLPRRRQILVGDGQPTGVAFREGDNRFAVDLLEDLKTGAFLDQRENHLRATAYMPPGGRGLDAFSYHGGFALALATRASHVVAIEQNPLALARLRAADELAEFRQLHLQFA